MTDNLSEIEYDFILDVETVEAYMFRKHITRGALASAIGCNIHTVTHYFNNPGEIRLKTVSDIARVLSGGKYPDRFIKCVARRRAD